MGHLIHRWRGPPSPTGEGAWYSSLSGWILCISVTDRVQKAGFLARYEQLRFRKTRKALFTGTFPSGGRGTAPAVDEVSYTAARKSIRVFFPRFMRTLRDENHWVAARNAEKPGENRSVRGGLIAKHTHNRAPYGESHLRIPPMPLCAVVRFARHRGFLGRERTLPVPHPRPRPRFTARNTRAARERRMTAAGTATERRETRRSGCSASPPVSPGSL